MEVIDLNKNNHNINIEESVIGLGNFDGLHLGHIELIKKVKYISNKKKVKSAILLFKKHTLCTINNNNDFILTTFKDKIEILKEFNIDYVFTLNFNDELKLMNSECFLKLLKEKTDFKYLVVGKDYRFGNKAKGNILTLKLAEKKYKFTTIVIDDYTKDNVFVKSTKIRELLKKGNIKKANKLLNRSYSINGIVIHGKGRGTGLGFPTANLLNKSNYLIPKEGVYLTNTIINNKRYNSITSIGYNDTFNDGELKIETNIINFNDDIYGQIIKIEFLDYIRNNIKFDSKEDLILQIQKDLIYIKP